MKGMPNSLQQQMINYHNDPVIRIMTDLKVKLIENAPFRLIVSSKGIEHELYSPWKEELARIELVIHAHQQTVYSELFYQPKNEKDKLYEQSNQGKKKQMP